MIKSIDFAAELLLIEAEIKRARAYYLLSLNKKDNEAMCIAAMKNAHKQIAILIENTVSPNLNLFVASK